MKTVLDLANSIRSPAVVAGGTILDIPEDLTFGSRGALSHGASMLLSDVLVMVDPRGAEAFEIPGWYRICQRSTKHDGTSRVVPGLRIIEARRQLLPFRPIAGVAFLTNFVKIDEMWHDFVWFQDESDAVEYSLRRHENR